MRFVAQSEIREKNIAGKIGVSLFGYLLTSASIQGITIKPLVRVLRIRLKAKDISMTKEVTRGVRCSTDRYTGTVILFARSDSQI